MEKAIVITGVAGLIGSKFADWLLVNCPDATIIGIDDLSDGYLENVDPRVKMYIRDCAEDLTDIFEQHDVRYVFHFAARAAESMAGFNRKFFHTNNVISSANLINCCINYNVKRIVFASSMSVYGHNPAPFTEDQIPSPADPYGIGKYAVELDLAAAYKQHGLEYCIFRGHSIYGPKQNLWDKYRNVLGIWMRQILSDEPITIYGDGSQTRAFTYIDDIMMPLWRCAISPETKNKTYNIGNDSVVSISEAANVLLKITGTDKVKYMESIYEVPHAYCDHKLAEGELGLTCTTSLEDGLRLMWQWAKEQPHREVKIWDKFEVKKDLYEMWKK